MWLTEGCVQLLINKFIARYFGTNEANHHLYEVRRNPRLLNRAMPLPNDDLLLNCPAPFHLSVAPFARPCRPLASWMQRQRPSLWTRLTISCTVSHSSYSCVPLAYACAIEVALAVLVTHCACLLAVFTPCACSSRRSAAQGQVAGAAAHHRRRSWCRQLVRGEGGCIAAGVQVHCCQQVFSNIFKEVEQIRDVSSRAKALISYNDVCWQCIRPLHCL